MQNKLANKRVIWHLENLYGKGQEDCLEKIKKLLSGKKAEKIQKEFPGMNGEAWAYWIEENLKM